MITVVFALFSVFLCIALYFSIKKNLEMMSILEDVADDYRNLLDELNYYFARVEKKSKMELFLDEPVTRELVEDIKGTKKVIKNAAEKISVFIEEEETESRS